MTTLCIAIPIRDGRLDPHFGRCAAVALLTTDGQRVLQRQDAQPPRHGAGGGALPRWLIGQGVQVVIAGGMGEPAQARLEQAGVRVILGAPSDTPEALAERFLAGALDSRGGTCAAHRHGHDQHDHGQHGKGCACAGHAP